MVPGDAAVGKAVFLYLGDFSFGTGGLKPPTLQAGAIAVTVQVLIITNSVVIGIASAFTIVGIWIAAASGTALLIGLKSVSAQHVTHHRQTGAFVAVALGPGDPVAFGETFVGIGQSIFAAYRAFVFRAVAGGWTTITFKD